MTQEEQKTAAKDRLLRALPVLRALVRKAAGLGEPMGFVVGVTLDRTGRSVGQFSIAELARDVALLVDYVGDEKEEGLDLAAEEILSQLR